MLKFAFVEMHEKVARRTAGDFLRRLIAAVPYKVHTVLTDNGTHFTTPGNTSSAAPDIKAALEAGELVWAHAFEYACAQNDIDHRLTKPEVSTYQWVSRKMNRTIKDATVKRYFYETHDQLRAHLHDFVDAYNFARRLKTLTGLTPNQFVCKDWTPEPPDFEINPLQQMPGLNTSRTLMAICRRGTIATVAGRHAKTQRRAGAGIEGLARSNGRELKGRGVPLRRGMGQSRAMSREGRHDPEALARLDDGS